MIMLKLRNNITFLVQYINALAIIILSDQDLTLMEAVYLLF